MVRSVPATTMAGYQDLSDLERGVIVGAREMGHSISGRYEIWVYEYNHFTSVRTISCIRQNIKISDIAAAGKIP